MLRNKLPTPSLILAVLSATSGMTAWAGTGCPDPLSPSCHPYGDGPFVGTNYNPPLYSCHNIGGTCAEAKQPGQCGPSATSSTKCAPVTVTVTCAYDTCSLGDAETGSGYCDSGTAYGGNWTTTKGQSTGETCGYGG